MGPGDRWSRPTTVQEAAKLAATGGVPVGGGTLLLSGAFPSPAGPIVDLDGLVPDGCWGDSLGANATLADAVEATRHHWPAVAGALLSTANPGVRRLATVGGTIASRLPSCDLAAALAAHRAQVESVGPDGVATTSSFIDFWRDADRHRIVTEVRLGPPARGAYRRHSGRRGPTPALASVAATVNERGVTVWGSTRSRSASSTPCSPATRTWPGTGRSRPSLWPNAWTEGRSWPDGRTRGGGRTAVADGDAASASPR